MGHHKQADTLSGSQQTKTSSQDTPPISTNAVGRVLGVVQALNCCVGVTGCSLHCSRKRAAVLPPCSFLLCSGVEP
jgi:hypothetical protein